MAEREKLQSEDKEETQPKFGSEWDEWLKKQMDLAKVKTVKEFLDGIETGKIPIADIDFENDRSEMMDKFLTQKIEEEKLQELGKPLDTFPGGAEVISQAETSVQDVSEIKPAADFVPSTPLEGQSIPPTENAKDLEPKEPLPPPPPLAEESHKETDEAPAQEIKEIERQKTEYKKLGEELEKLTGEQKNEEVWKKKAGLYKIATKIIELNKKTQEVSKIINEAHKNGYYEKKSIKDGKEIIEKITVGEKEKVNGKLTLSKSGKYYFEIAGRKFLVVDNKKLKKAQGKPPTPAPDASPLPVTEPDFTEPSVQPAVEQEPATVETAPEQPSFDEIQQVSAELDKAFAEKEKFMGQIPNLTAEEQKTFNEMFYTFYYPEDNNSNTIKNRVEYLLKKYTLSGKDAFRIAIRENTESKSKVQKEKEAQRARDELGQAYDEPDGANTLRDARIITKEEQDQIRQNPITEAVPEAPKKKSWWKFW